MDQLQDRPYGDNISPGGDLAAHDTLIGTPTLPPGRYARPQQALHWIVAILVFAQLGGGLWMSTLPRAGHAVLLRDIMYAHLANGTVIFCLTAWRLTLRRRLGIPAPIPGTPVDSNALALANHGAFYALLLALPVLGWLTYISPRGQVHAILAATHGGTALALAFAIAAHLAGVFYHSFVRHDPLLRRMAG
jgi:cytochrome b561